MYNLWGIVNLTPNSFSDGGELSSVEQVKQRVRLFTSRCAVLDFGAESTAPFNQPISVDEEINRLEQLFLPIFDSAMIQGKQISIDTYHPETFTFVYKQINSFTDDVRLIWNDVSGVWDESVQQILTDTDAYYVFSHTNVPSREKTSYHMDFVQEISGDEFMQQFFGHYSPILKNERYKDRIVIDPCFGFSKSYSQNWLLLNNLNKIIDFFSDYNILIGISRKSFLKKSLESENRAYDTKSLDQYHKELIVEWSKRLDLSNCSFRVHNPSIF
jgi:dihydropteroate synthase